MIGISGFAFAIYTYLKVDSPELNYRILTNTNVLDLKEDIGNLDIVYNGSSIKKSSETIYILTIRIGNEGLESITNNLYDTRSLPGLKIENARLAEFPQIIESSSEYLESNLTLVTDSLRTVRFEPIILDEADYFILKFLLIGGKTEKPLVTSIGKVAGIRNIEIIKITDDPKKESLWARVIDGSFGIHVLRYLFYVFAFILIALVIVLPISSISDAASTKKRKRIVRHYKLAKGITEDLEHDYIFSEYVKEGINFLQDIEELISDSQKLSKLVTIENNLDEVSYGDLDFLGIQLDKNQDLAEALSRKNSVSELIKISAFSSDPNNLGINNAFLTKLSSFIQYVDQTRK